MTHPDFIAIDAAQTVRVEATHADILVAVSGSSLFSGETALQKAREVADLAAALRAIGIEDGQIQIETIRLETQSGTFSKTSSANYALRIGNVLLDKVADCVGAVATAKNATLNSIAWRFSDENPVRDALRQNCLGTAMERAKNVAQTLGVRLLGIYEMDEKWQGVQAETTPHREEMEQMLGSMARTRKVSEAELGMAVTHAEVVRMELKLKFRVSEFVQK